MKLPFEIPTYVWTLVSPFVAAFLTYVVAIRSKRKDVDIQREQKLNTVLSDLLLVWQYLGKLEDIVELNLADSFIPKEIAPYLILKSGKLDDKCFKEFEKSVLNLKEYAPITYYELEGLGKRYDFMRSNYILPYLNAKNPAKYNQELAQKYIQDTIEEIEDYLKAIAKITSRRISRKVKKRIKKHISKDTKDLIFDMTIELYEIFEILNPEEMKDKSFDEFQEQVKEPEYGQLFKSTFELLIENEMNVIMKMVAENPHITIEELRENLKNIN